MVRRLIDIVLSIIGLVVIVPVLALAAVGIFLSDPGPIFYRARRVGLNGRQFCLYKLRTMYINQGSFSNAITSQSDPRVFRFGAWLRRLKIDELPQLLNILKGDMSIIGPRPEDPTIVEKYYLPEHFETLSRLPGLASPGSIYNYTHGEEFLTGDEIERIYAERLLPIKLALDTVYIRDATIVYDMRLCIRALWAITCTALGKTQFSDPPELTKAIQVRTQPAIQSTHVPAELVTLHGGRKL
jgi:lipopolysaccharide/colanic/teichoic acid biosynthesis glycosyltransferase